MHLALHRLEVANHAVDEDRRHDRYSYGRDNRVAEELFYHGKVGSARVVELVAMMEALVLVFLVEDAFEEKPRTDDGLRIIRVRDLDDGWGTRKFNLEQTRLYRRTTTGGSHLPSSFSGRARDPWQLSTSLAC